MKNKIDNIIYIIIIFSAIFISFHFGCAYGVLKERNDKVCVEPYELRNWESSIVVVETVYKHVISTFSEDLAEAHKETEKWRDRYFIIKRQSEKAAEKEE